MGQKTQADTDSRVRRTKRVIREALVQLLQKYDLDKISITMLCKEADVSRTAFYSHYSIPEDCFAEIMCELMKNLDAENRQENRDIVGAMSGFIACVKANRRLFDVCYSLGFYHPLVQMSFEYNLAYMNDFLGDWKGVSDTDLRFCNYGMFGLISDWLKQGCPGDASDILEFYRNFLTERGVYQPR